MIGGEVKRVHLTQKIIFWWTRMDKLGEDHLELQRRVRGYWEKHSGEDMRYTYPSSPSITINNLALIGLTTGVTAGLVQHYLNRLHMIVKLEKIPIFQHARPAYQTRMQSLGRVILSGAKGSATASFYGASYWLFYASGMKDYQSLFFSGLTAGSIGGTLCE